MTCPFGTMDWYCALPAGHDGPHQSAPLTAETEAKAKPTKKRPASARDGGA